eukprot:CAMPEP_0115043572 /NCGR_PEP_ID=MMETSP0216-20121206/46945_1 /TAXON_ID=223996 /ORGANISM="Protocruzia adherens, Strain Boccale" /LENGTH=119 /DNA_ID=CAMNT_0002425911 /DNA_START=871 /DNA_END=1230 /DNA_ORIENTATION=-
MISHFLFGADSTVFFILLTIGWTLIGAITLTISRGLPKVLYTGKHQSDPIASLVRPCFRGSGPIDSAIVAAAKKSMAYENYNRGTSGDLQIAGNRVYEPVSECSQRLLQSKNTLSKMKK